MSDKSKSEGCSGFPARRSISACCEQERLAFAIRGSGRFSHPLLLGCGHGVSNLLLDLEERTGFPSQLHLVEDDLNHLAEELRFKLADELLEHLLFAGHRFGTDEVRAGDLGPVLLQPHLLIGPLATEPEGQRRNLGAPQVDVDAVQVVGEDQPGNIPPQVFQLRVILLECRAEVGVGVGFLVDRQQQVEAVQQEVAAAAGRVENLQFPWVFLRAVRDVDRELEQFFLRKIVSPLGSVLGRLFPFLQENLGWATDHVPALVLELRVALPHLVPDAAQRVVGEEFDHVAGREELVAKGQFVGVAGSLRSPCGPDPAVPWA